MSSRMTDAPTSQNVEETTSPDPPSAPNVSVIVAAIEGADLGAALATVDRQAYEGIEGISVVGLVNGDLPEGVERAVDLESAIADASDDVDYFWLLHSDARPRPDALGALVDGLERNQASLGASKLLVAGSHDVLESIGSATDIFGEPFSGLDEGEIDLEQYDVVREVAFVASVSMLVRRDLAQGLGGLDDKLRPGAAGLDFSQRVRLAGGSVITVPSSEVYHQGRCGPRDRGWREQSGRFRAMLKAYSLLTLAWVIPYNFIVATIDSLANLLFLRWRPAARHGAAWAWNAFRLPSTIGSRRRFRPVRVVGDEELFRFQSRGSVHLREVGSELSNRLLSVFDDDQALARSSRRIWTSPGIWGAVIGAVLALFAARSIFFTGVPNVGFSFPFEAPSVAFDRFFGGWNQAGLGSPASVHPAVGFAGLTSFLWFGAEGAARTLLTIGFGVFAVAGMGRLGGRLGFVGPGRYLSGLVLVAGPGTALLAGAGSWISLGAAALLPWAVRSVFMHPSDRENSRWVHLAFVVVWSILLGSLSPVLALVPFLAAVIWLAVGGDRASWWLALGSLIGPLVGAAFLVGDVGWLLDDQRRLGLVVDDLWPVLIALTAVPILFVEDKARRLGLFGAILGLGGLALARLPMGGPGVEESFLILASFGAAIVVAASLDAITADLRRVVAALAAVALLALSIGSMAGGRLGLPPGDRNDELSFASALANEGKAGRILTVSFDRSLISGEARPGPALWFRTVEGDGMTLDQVWLPDPLPGDAALGNALERIASGAELRPGELLAPFAIDWVVIDGLGSPLDQILPSQLDLIPKPLLEGSAVYENPGASPLVVADNGFVWERDGAGFEGVKSDSDRVNLAYNYDGGWAPDPDQVDWAVTVAATEGLAWYRGSGLIRFLPIAAAILFVVSLIGLIVERLRR